MTYIIIPGQKAVKPMMRKPKCYPRCPCSESVEYNAHLLTLPTYSLHESLKDLPVNTELDKVREQWRVDTSSYQGSASHYFDSEIEAEKKFQEWYKYEGQLQAHTSKPVKVLVPIGEKEERVVTKDDLFKLLAEYGGTIESTGKMDEMNIKQARASGRMYVDQYGLGYVWMPGDFSNGAFPETVEEVELFEKWFPLEVELPEEMKDPNWLFTRKRNQSGKLAHLSNKGEGEEREVIRTEKDDGKVRFYWKDNDAPLGYAYSEVDGYYVFVIESNGGSWPDYLLKAIADKLTDMNKDWDAQITKTFSPNS